MVEILRLQELVAESTVPGDCGCSQTSSKYLA